MRRPPPTPALFTLPTLVALASTSLGVAQEPALTPTPTPLVRRSDGTSLADIARRAREKREASKTPVRSLGTLTNESVKPKGGESKGASTSATPRPSGKAPTPEPTLGAWKDNKGRTEADWRRMVSVAKERVTKAEAEEKSLDDEAKRLQNDFYAWSDGNYRDRVIKPNWDATREKLRRAQAEVEKAREAVADLEEEARKSNAPPGWLR